MTVTEKKEQSVRGILVPLFAKKHCQDSICLAIKTDDGIYYVSPKLRGKELEQRGFKRILATGMVTEDKDGDPVIHISRYIFL
jgi:hypothetical protein